MINFTTAEDEAKRNGVKALIYGPAGMGKTVLMATLPRPVLLSAESGLLSLRQKNLERIFGVGNPTIAYSIPVIVIKTVDDLMRAYDWCSNPANSGHFDSCGLDSVSEIAEVVLANAKPQVKDPRQAYGELIEQMEQVVKAFRDLPNKHVCMAAKMEPIKDGITGAIKYGPSMPGQKLGPALPYFFSEVFRLGIAKHPQSGEQYRFIQTQPDLQHEAKDRSGALSPVEVPNMTTIINKILGD